MIVYLIVMLLEKMNLHTSIRKDGVQLWSHTMNSNEILLGTQTSMKQDRNAMILIQNKTKSTDE